MIIKETFNNISEYEFVSEQDITGQFARSELLKKYKFPFGLTITFSLLSEYE
jgi:hypothetical protein